MTAVAVGSNLSRAKRKAAKYDSIVDSALPSVPSQATNRVAFSWVIGVGGWANERQNAKYFRQPAWYTFLEVSAKPASRKKSTAASRSRMPTLWDLGVAGPRAPGGPVWVEGTTVIGVGELHAPCCGIGHQH